MKRLGLPLLFLALSAFCRLPQADAQSGMLPQVSLGTPAAPTSPAVPGVMALPAYNATIVQQIHTMPTAGGYSASHAATQRLGGSVLLTPLGLDVAAAQAQPSYCSGATYLVFLKTVAALQRAGELSLDPATLGALTITAA